MGQPGLSRYFLGGEPTLNPGTNFTQGCLRKTFFTQVYSLAHEQVQQEESEGSRAVFSFASIPTHIKPGLHLKPDLCEPATSPSYHSRMGNARLTPFSLPRESTEQAGPRQGETLLKNRRASSYLQRIGNNYMATGFAEEVMGDLKAGLFVCVRRASSPPPPRS